MLPKRKIEGRALLHRTLGPYFTAVVVNNALHRRQTDTGALEFGRRV